MNEPTYTEPTKDDAIFEVRDQDGHVWRIYEDGRISGFPNRCVIVNLIPARIAQATTGCIY